MNSMVDVASARLAMSFDDASRIQIMAPVSDDVINTHANLHVRGERTMWDPEPA